MTSISGVHDQDYEYTNQQKCYHYILPRQDDVGFNNWVVPSAFFWYLVVLHR